MSLITQDDVHSIVNVKNTPNESLNKLAEVIDIILDESHPDFNNDYSNIGKIKIRYLTDSGRADELLLWAYPLMSSFKQYPVLHETVEIHNLYNKLFYIVINYNNYINNNSIPGVSTVKFKNVTDNLNNYSSSKNIPNKKTEENYNMFGKTFNNSNDKIKPVQPFEGDVLFQGRFGNTIRLGNNKETNKPNIKINVGQENKTDELSIRKTYTEDINDDTTQIWMTYDENIDIKPATIENDHHLKSAKNLPNKYNGQQITLSSNRILLNSRKNEIQLFSNTGTSICTNGYFSLDTVDEIGITTKDNFNVESNNKFNFKNSNGTFIDSPKILLGKNAKEPIVLGDKLVSLLSDLIDVILKETHPTGTGPSGPPINSADYIKIKQKLKTVLSSQNRSL